MPGILLFSLVAVLGLVALVFAVLHLSHGSNDPRREYLHGGIGLFCLLLGVRQALRLARTPHD